jgi:ankyrin repeat protein
MGATQSLKKAVDDGNLKLVIESIKAGADISMRDTKSGATASEYARVRGHHHISAYIDAYALLKEPPDAANIEGNRAVTLAAKWGHEDLLSAAIAKGCDVNAKDRSGSTALHLAADAGRVHTLKQLLSANADVNAVNVWGQTALALIVNSDEAGERTRALVGMLLSAKADANIPANSGVTALMRAVAASSDGNIDTLSALLHAKANPTAADNSGGTALHLAAARSSSDPVELLLKARASADARTRAGQTALMTACERGYVKVADTLLTHHARVNIALPSGATALLLACECADRSATLALLQKLLPAGADAGHCDLGGESALWRCATRHDLPGMQCLLDHGARVTPASAAERDVRPVLDNSGVTLEPVDKPGQRVVRPPPTGGKRGFDSAAPAGGLLFLPRQPLCFPVQPTPALAALNAGASAVDCTLPMSPLSVAGGAAGGFGTTRRPAPAPPTLGSRTATTSPGSAAASAAPSGAAGAAAAAAPTLTSSVYAYTASYTGSAAPRGSHPLPPQPSPPAVTRPAAVSAAATAGRPPGTRPQMPLPVPAGAGARPVSFSTSHAGSGHAGSSGDFDDVPPPPPPPPEEEEGDDAIYGPGRGASTPPPPPDSEPDLPPTPVYSAPPAPVPGSTPVKLPALPALPALPQPPVPASARPAPALPSPAPAVRPLRPGHSSPTWPSAISTSGAGVGSASVPSPAGSAPGTPLSGSTDKLDRLRTASIGSATGPTAGGLSVGLGGLGAGEGAGSAGTPRNAMFPMSPATGTGFGAGPGVGGSGGGGGTLTGTRQPVPFATPAAPLVGPSGIVGVGSAQGSEAPGWDRRVSFGERRLSEAGSGSGGAGGSQGSPGGSSRGLPLNAALPAGAMAAAARRYAEAGTPPHTSAPASQGDSMPSIQLAPAVAVPATTAAPVVRGPQRTTVAPANPEDDCINWRRAINADTNLKYYYNAVTKTTSWVQPPCVALTAPACACGCDTFMPHEVKVAKCVTCTHFHTRGFMQ